MSHLSHPGEVSLGSDLIRVLHVDDQSDFVEMSGELLERESDRIHTVSETSAAAGLDYLEDGMVDCVVSDYDMPEMNGLEFLEALRREFPDLPFILFTGKGSEEIASEAISAGVTDYLQKGVGTDNFTVLANRVENAVQQYRSQQTVEATEQKLSQLADRTDDILFMFDGDWSELLFINSAYEDIWGCSIDELREDPHSFIDHIHPDDRSVARESVAKLQDGHTDTVEYRVEFMDGEYRWVRGETKPIFDEDGNVSRISGYVRDISDHKDREQELEAQIQAMEAASDGIAILNEDQEFVYVNETHADIYGFGDPDTLIGESWRTCYADGEVAEFEDDVLPSLLDSGRWQGEMEVTAADGHSLHQELTLERLEDGRIVCTVRDITEQKAHEKSLERYKILTQEVTDSISVVSEDGTIQYKNPAIERILGYEPSRLEGETVFDYMHPDDRERVQERFSELVSSDSAKTDRIEYRMKHADGSWRWLESEASNQVETVMDGHVITSRDITDRVEREQELEQYAALVDSMADPALIVSDDYSIEFANDAALEYGTVSGEEIEGASIEEFSREIGASQRDTGKLQSIVDSALTEDGAESSTQSVEIELESGMESDYTEFRVIGATINGNQTVVITGRDISDRKRREEALTRLHHVTNEFMEATDQRSVAEYAIETASEVLDQPVSGVWLFDEAADALQPVAVTNEGREVIPDVPTFEQGEGLAWTVYETGEVQAFSDLRNEPGLYNPETVIRSEILLPLGEYGLMVIGSTTENEFDELDEALARVLANTVETALARADREARLRSQHADLQRQNERLDQFASVVSHDLRNPLSVASGLLELSKDDIDPDDFERISQAHARMETLIDDLLTLAREGNASTDIQPVPLDAMVSRSWKADELTDASVVNETAAVIEADRSRLKQLLENLFRNAVDHGGESVTVTVGDLENGFFVEDDGTGIPEEKRDDVFDMGYSTSKEGTGFGLSIVDQVVAAHDWEIAVTEGVDGGARFEITAVEFEDTP